MLKKLIMIFFCLTALTTAQRKILLISPNDEGGYDVSENDRNLISEYTDLNSDSITLSTLEEIYLDTPQNNNRINIPTSELMFIIFMFGILIGIIIRHSINYPQSV